MNMSLRSDYFVSENLFSSTMTSIANLEISQLPVFAERNIRYTIQIDCCQLFITFENPTDLRKFRKSSRLIKQMVAEVKAACEQVCEAVEVIAFVDGTGHYCWEGEIDKISGCDIYIPCLQRIPCNYKVDGDTLQIDFKNEEDCQNFRNPINHKGFALNVASLAREYGIEIQNIQYCLNGEKVVRRSMCSLLRGMGASLKDAMIASLFIDELEAQAA